MPASLPLQSAAAPVIRRLSPLVAAQIAAGEVIERPASVVKELLDNAVDAGATQVTVEIEQGGVELIRVSDNGCGIAADQLALAVAEHATSKITDAADLDRITTMGFRGEALASIASVSRLSIRSRTASEGAAAVIEVEGDSVSGIRPEAGPVGTLATIRNLFFNTPARRKFLRTSATEQGHCADVVRQLAMSRPGVGFTLKCDGRVLLDVPPGQGPRERALAVIGREMESQYLEAHADEFDDTRGVALWALVGKPSLSRATNKWQHIFLNGRPIRDKTIQHGLREAYRGLIEPSKHPAAVLMLEMDPGAVDVNVHPSKAEVRFRDGSLVHSVVFRAVREALRSADLTPVVEGPSAASVGFMQDAIPGAPGGRFNYEELRAAVEAKAVEGVDTGYKPVPLETVGRQELARPVAPRMMQVHNSYIVTQDEQGVVIIDQHALHERVMFEKLTERISRGELESQRLLMPAVVNVPSGGGRVEALERIAGLLKRLGIVAEPLGPRSVGVHAFPSFLFDRKVDPAEFVGELLEKAEAEKWSGATDEAALHEVLDMMACKAAVKAGDSLTDDELRELLALREQVERASNCPHGRPTTIRMSIKELERRFGRT